MKCKECKAIIPDNARYCPDCGAIPNPPEEKDCIHAVYDDNGNRRSAPSYPVSQNPASQAKSVNNGGKIKVIVAVVAIIIAACIACAALITFLLNGFDELNYGIPDDENFYGDSHASLYLNDGYGDEQEQVALEYIENYLIDGDLETFYDLTCFDVYALYYDSPLFRNEEDSTDNEEEPSYSTGLVYFDIFNYIYDYVNIHSFSLNGASDVEFSISYCQEISQSELYDFYYFYVDDDLSQFNRESLDYLAPYDSLTDIYDICVDVIITEGYDTTTISTWVVVADAGEGPVVVYDELMRSAIVSML